MSFTQHIFVVAPCCWVYLLFVLLQVEFYYMNTYNLFIHSHVDGHLGCFQFLAFENKVAIILMYKLLCGHMFSLLLGKYIILAWLSYMVGLHFSDDWYWAFVNALLAIHFFFIVCVQLIFCSLLNLVFVLLLNYKSSSGILWQYALTIFSLFLRDLRFCS